MITDLLEYQILAEIVHLDHIRTLNILRLGKFPSLNTVETMAKTMNGDQQDDVARLFGEGEPLDPIAVKELLTSIDKTFRLHMINFRGEPKERFGTSDPKHQKAMDNYKRDVMNILNTWQKKFESGKGKKYGSLAARAAYAFKKNEEGLLGRPLLTISYIETIDWLLSRIPSTLQEVSDYYFELITSVSWLQVPRIVHGQYEVCTPPQSRPRIVQGRYEACSTAITAAYRPWTI